MFAIACFRGTKAQADTIKALLIKGADVDDYSEHYTGLTPLMMACHLKSDEDSLTVAKMLIDQYPDLDLFAEDIAQNTVLHHAAMENKLEVCKYLLEEKKVMLHFMADRHNQDGLTAIDLSSKKEVFEYLSQYSCKLDKKPKKFKRDKRGFTFKTKYGAALK